MRASRVLRERGMPHGLILNQHRVLASEKLGDILRVHQWGDGVDLSWYSRSAITRLEKNSRD
jgi:hypothetical protein